jgi:hypothetical protein
MSFFHLAQDASKFKAFLTKRLEIPGRKIWPLKKIKVKMGLKKQEAWVDGIVLFRGGFCLK